MGRPETLFQTFVDDGERAILDLLATRASEELYLDFKGCATKAVHNRLQQDDRDNHAKAISGFGNTAGGVVVWGVDCRNDPTDGDVARMLKPVEQVERFKSWLEADVSGATVPSHIGIRHAVSARRPNGSGFVITLVPAAENSPLQHPTRFTYYMRAGSSFMPIPHQMLAAMFGRRPAPQLRIQCRGRGELEMTSGQSAVTWAEVIVRNEGLGIARDVFMTLRVRSLPVDEGHGSLEILPGGDPRLSLMHGPPLLRTIMLSSGIAFPPGSEARLAILKMTLPEVIQRELSVEISVGAENAAPVIITISQTRNRLQHTVSLARRLSNASRAWLAERCFGLNTDEP